MYFAMYSSIGAITPPSANDGIQAGDTSRTS
jgi:hypothetical protein